MGYYVHVQPTTKSAAREMLAFLGVNFRPAKDLFPLLPPHSGNFMSHPPGWAREVCAYAQRKNDIGYYRTAGWSLEEEGYCENLLRWIALQIGKKKEFQGDSLMESERLPEGVENLLLPCTWYEHEPVPILLTSAYPQAFDGWEDGNLVNCDDLGWAPSFRPWPPEMKESQVSSRFFREIRERKKKADPLVRAEIARLDALWAQR